MGFIMTPPLPRYGADRDFARERDARDPLRRLRDAFVIPPGEGRRPVRYFCGHSLGLMPRAAPDLVNEVLDDWGRFAVEGHFRAPNPWYRYQELFRGSLSRLAGASEEEVTLMNGLTVNLHLLMASFYRPTAERYRILIEDPVFPSDLYALKTQARLHGLDPEQVLIQARPREGEAVLRPEDLELLLEREGGSIALVWLGGVNFLTGQWFDLPRIARAARRAGCLVGADLAHAIGNVPLALHDWDVDFAVWCSYKYLNGGPGALAGIYVHRRHARDTDLFRLGGWWGNDPETRFRMQLRPEFVPVPSADGWQVSNPAILALAPLRASLDLFDRAGMSTLRRKSVELTGYLEFLLRRTAPNRVQIVTPPDPGARGCQLSLRIRDGARRAQEELASRSIVCDFREPDILRAAPVPSYNTYDDVWTLASALAD
jgi:kynureninase